MERLIIENFGGIANLELEISSVNILIGPQASGKSVSAKLLFFFKTFFNEIFKAIDAGDTKRDLDRKAIDRFVNYFPRDSWPKNDFTLQYIIGNDWLSISKKSKSPLRFDYSSGIKTLTTKCRSIYRSEQNKILKDPQKHFRAINNARNKYSNLLHDHFHKYAAYTQFFIPAGRSFYANVQSGIFTFLSENKSLDPFLIDFGSFYESFKKFAWRELKDNPTEADVIAFDQLINEILNGEYIREKEKDYLLHSDKRRVNLSNASSGQQETLPLLIILKTLHSIKTTSPGSTLYIEEPEAHLFPTAQKRIVQLLARLVNQEDGDFQLIITTHSPYILAAFNNLIEAGKLKSVNTVNKSKLFSIVPAEETLDPGNIRAYSLNNGVKRI
ncbi:MAG: AAA family ATPase [Flavobacteriales bacterium]